MSSSKKNLSLLMFFNFKPTFCLKSRAFSLKILLPIFIMANGLSGCQTLTKTDDTNTKSALLNQEIEALLPKLPIDIPPTNDVAVVPKINLKDTRLDALLNAESPRLPGNYVHTLAFDEKTNLWDQLSANFYLTPAYTEHFESYLTYYQKHTKHLYRVSKRAKPYLYFISQEVAKRQMPYEIALLPIVESGFSPAAHSYVGAAGLWQFMPNTGDMFGLQQTWWYDGRRDIYHSTHAALDYLQQLYKQNNYDWLLALASYNAGYGNILKAKRHFLKKHPNGTPHFWNIRPYLPKETQQYVPQLLAITYLIKHRNYYKLKLEPIENKNYFEKIDLTKQVAFNRVIQHSKVSKKQFKQLNPGYLKATTPPKGPYQLLLPLDNAAHFKMALSSQPDMFKIQWAKYKIKPGDSLSVIASHYHTSSKAIKSLNSLKSNRIRAGKTLLIPMPASHATLLASQTPKKASGQYHIHHVRKNESLWTIAHYYNIKTRTLCEWNRISIRDPIRTGQTLKIRTGQYGKKITYTLKHGDSLWKIAKKYQVTTTELTRWNNLNRSTVLHPGKKISLWVKS